MECRDYTVSDIQRQFPELYSLSLEDSTLFPILDVLITDFLNSTFIYPGQYDITDFCTYISQEGINHVIYVIHGKLVKIHCEFSDIDAFDDDESWWIKCRLAISGTASTEFFERIKNFINALQLEDLRLRAMDKLKEGKIYHLSTKTRKYYELS